MDENLHTMSNNNILIAQINSPTRLITFFDQYDKIGKNLFYFSGDTNIDYLEGYVCYINDIYIAFDLNDLIGGRLNQYIKSGAEIIIDSELKIIPYDIYNDLIYRSYLFETDTNDKTIKEVLEPLLNYLKDNK
jgi:hypothetical protein